MVDFGIQRLDGKLSSQVVGHCQVLGFERSRWWKISDHGLTSRNSAKRISVYSFVSHHFFLTCCVYVMFFESMPLICLGKTSDLDVSQRPFRSLSRWLSLQEWHVYGVAPMAFYPRQPPLL